MVVVMAYLIVKEAVALARTARERKPQNEQHKIEELLRVLIEEHHNPDSMFSTYGLRDRIAELETLLRKHMDECKFKPMVPPKD